MKEAFAQTMNKSVIVGMSGGVDSSAAACLLLEQGYDVIGVTLQIWPDESRYNTNGSRDFSAIEDARRVARFLNIPHYILNCKEEFRKEVIDYFVNEYIQGRTPNPCIVCNRYVKWAMLQSKAKQLGADYIATGHYASIRKHPDTGRLCVCSSAVPNKDQSYMLYALTQEQIAATLLPIGEYSKKETRDLAVKYNLPVANKPDSQDICFIPDGDYAGFITEYTSTALPEGNFIDETGYVLGRHKGIIHYTVGQRKGLGITCGKPMYVKSISALNNTITLSEDISVSEMTVKNINWMAYSRFKNQRRLSVKIRYSHKRCAANVEYDADDEEKIRCRFDEPQRAVTPGQAAVFYDGEYIAFGGVIE